MKTSNVSRRMCFATLAIVMMLIAAACGEDDASGSDSGREWDQPITFGEGLTDSYQFHTRVAQFIIENGYEYETDVIVAETISLIQGMLSGDINATMEVWADQTPAYVEAVEEGTLVDLGFNYEESIQGWFVPRYVIEGDPERGIEPMAPDLQHIDDLPQYKDLFQDPEVPDKGRFVGCIAGWECERVDEAKFAAYGLNEHYNRFLPGSAAALATSLVSAYEQGEPWFGYYWAPTWIFAQLDLVLIEEPPYSDECWEDIFGGQVACAYPSVEVSIAGTPEFVDAAPEIVEFLENYESTMDETSEVLLYMFENEAVAEEAALWWLNDNEATWSTWVPDDVAERVRTALEEE